MIIIDFFSEKRKWRKFKKYWRQRNKHNFTMPTRILPSDLVEIGNYSYGPIDFLYWGTSGEKLIIGNYVSIAANVKFILGGEHHLNYATTYPFKVKISNEKIEALTNGPIILEDEVWIGYGVTILSGVRIGRGAVIGAGSVVAKDVPPYAIVVGNPQKIIKYRFTQSIIDRLLRIDISSIESDLIKKNIELFYSTLDDSVLSKLEHITIKKQS